MVYEESNSPINKTREEEFKKIHNPNTRKKNGNLYRLLLLCSSTDESGFDNNSQRSCAWSKINNYVETCKPDKKSFGRSHRLNGSRVQGTTLKHAGFKLNLILTIALDPDHPVQYYEINVEYTDGGVFSDFVENRNLSNFIRFDIIDRHGSHKAVEANIKRGKKTIKEAYEEINVLIDFIPAGQSKYNPVELAFSFICKFLADKASLYNDGSGWGEENLRKVLKEAIESITFRDVQGWYQRTWNVMYPNNNPPLYLLTNTPLSIIKKEIERITKEYDERSKIIKKSSRGRPLKKTLNKK